ncbi:MAG TPA: 3-hydroxybutyryl-CoA dehydrogenase [Terriglobia bacterium]|nr:3-hydroxybutyryl-CoA dehydrogenase [Terriglobia bacterium]
MTQLENPQTSTSPNHPMSTIGVVGAGQMGHGIAHVMLRAGHRVILLDVSQNLIEAGAKRIAKGLARDVEKERLTEEQRRQAVANLETTTDSAGLAEALYIIEAVTEKSDVKVNVFHSLEPHCPPETIFASNTSSISITRLAAATHRPDKFVGLHFFNPVPVMKLVEVVPGLQTAPETVDKAIALATSAGKTPVRVNDFPGFVSNRVLMPMINEAVFCLMEGVADAAGIDNVMKLGMNHPMGPLELADLIGLDVCLDIMKVLYESLRDPKYRPCPLLEKMVSAGWLGQKTGRGFYEYPRE